MSRPAGRLRRTLRRAANALRRSGEEAPPSLVAPFHHPPQCPDGCRTGPPDFVGIGAQKAGTTWFFNLLARHPGIHVPDFSGEPYPRDFTKERHFFDTFFWREWRDEDVQAYHRWFPRPPGALTGEWTPRYMVDWWTAPMLARAAGDALILVLLRDPVSRYESGMAQRQRKHRLWMDDAIAHRERGMYATQFKWWFTHVDPKRFLILQFERCIREPRIALDRTWHALGLKGVLLPEKALERRVNPRPLHALYRAPADLRRTLVRGYEEDVLELSQLLPDFDLKLWPNFSHLA